MLNNASITAAFNRAIGSHQNSQSYISEKENQLRLNALAKTPANPNKHAAAFGALSILTLLSVISNSNLSIKNELNNIDINRTLRNDIPSQNFGFNTQEASSDGPRTSGNLNNQPRISNIINNPSQQSRALLPISAIATTLNPGLPETIKKNDFFTLLPSASAHVIPTNKNTPAPEVTEDDFIKIEKIDFSCAEVRNSLSWDKVINQIGKTLKNPIVALSLESQVIHHFNSLKKRCPTPENSKKLEAIAQRADQIVSAVVTLVPYANPVVIAQNIVGPLMTLIADDIAGRPIDRDEVLDLIEQTIFFSKATVQFSPSSTNGKTIEKSLRIPEKIQAKNNKLFTTIEKKTWQLIFKESRFFALGQGELHEVTFSQTEKKWSFVANENGAPVTGTLLARLNRLGPDGIAQAGGLRALAKTYHVEPKTLESYIKSDARLSVKGTRMVEVAQNDPTRLIRSTLDSFYDTQASASDEKVDTSKRQEVITKPETNRKEMSESAAFPRAVEPQADALSGERQNHALMRSRVVVPDFLEKMDEKLIGAGDFSSRSSASFGQKSVGPSSRVKLRSRTRLKPFPKHSPKAISRVIVNLEHLGKQGIQEAGGLGKLAKINHVKLKMLERYIKPDGTFTRMGKHLLHRLKNKVPPKLISKLHVMGKAGIEKQGGLVEIARNNKVSLKVLESYIKSDGTLTPKGDRLYHRTQLKRTAPLSGDAVNNEQSAIDSPHSALNEKSDSTAHSASENNKIDEAGESFSSGINRGLIKPNKGVEKLVTRTIDRFNHFTLWGKVKNDNFPLIYNVEQDVFFLATKNILGQLRRTSNIPYIALESGVELSELPESERNREITNEQRTATLKALGNDLDLTAVDKWIEDDPNRVPIPQKISSVWVGTRKIPDHLVDNLIHNAEIAKSGSHPHEFTLFLSRNSEDASIENRALLQQKAPELNVVILEETPFYQKFKESKYYEQYKAAIEGNGGVATNYASAADVLRFQLMKEEGGIYMDTDDRLTSPPGTVALKTTPEGFVLHLPMSNKRLGMVFQYPTSVFGTHPGNPTLELISEEINVRYQNNRDIYLSKPAVIENEKFTDYAKRISYISGPGVFDSVIRRSRFNENQFLEAHRLSLLPLDTVRKGPLHRIFTRFFLSDISKLSEIVDVGSENSWKYTRR